MLKLCWLEIKDFGSKVETLACANQCRMFVIKGDFDRTWFQTNWKFPFEVIIYHFHGYYDYFVVNSCHDSLSSTTRPFETPIFGRFRNSKLTLFLGQKIEISGAPQRWTRAGSPLKRNLGIHKMGPLGCRNLMQLININQPLEVVATIFFWNYKLPFGRWHTPTKIMVVRKPTYRKWWLDFQGTVGSNTTISKVKCCGKKGF